MVLYSFSLMLMYVTHSAAAVEIKLLAHEQQPFQYQDKDGKVQGFAFELVDEIFKRAEVKIMNEKPLILPFARAYKIVGRTHNTAMYMTVRKAKREKLFQWVGPIASRKKWLYKLTANSKAQAKTLEDAKKLRVGAVNNSSTDEYLKKLGFDKLTLLADESLVFGMLLAGRIEMMPSLELTMAHKIRERGLTYNKVEKLLPFDSRYQYYLAVNKEVDPKVVARLQNALNEMKADGNYSSIRNKYFN